MSVIAYMRRGDLGLAVKGTAGTDHVEAVCLCGPTRRDPQGRVLRLTGDRWWWGLHEPTTQPWAPFCYCLWYTREPGSVLVIIHRSLLQSQPQHRRRHQPMPQVQNRRGGGRHHCAFQKLVLSPRRHQPSWTSHRITAENSGK